MTEQQLSAHLLTAINASLEGGKAIMQIYEREDFDIEIKKDKSPLTAADKKAHETILAALESTGLPVLSEEGKDTPYEERAGRTYFWLVDPLDGTKEFINRNGEFTVNIALIHEQLPVLGVIYVPAQDMLYFADPYTGSFKLLQASENPLDKATLQQQAQQLPLHTSNKPLTIVGSRSHMNEETTALIKKLEEKHDKVDLISKGSSLKLCMVAEGTAQFYPRIAPTMEWDTAAGHAIVRNMGGKVYVADDKNQELKYNKENLLNPHFIVEYNLPE